MMKQRFHYFAPQPGYDFREMIKKLLPNLHVLDDERLDDNSSSSVRHHVFDEDWAYLEELHDDALLHDEFPQKQDECMAPGGKMSQDFRSSGMLIMFTLYKFKGIQICKEMVFHD